MIIRAAIGLAGGFGAVLSVAFLLFLVHAADSLPGFIGITALPAFLVAMAVAFNASGLRQALGAELLWLGEILTLAAILSPIGHTRTTLANGEGLGASWLMASLMIAAIIGLAAFGLLYAGKRLTGDPAYLPPWLRRFFAA